MTAEDFLQDSLEISHFYHDRYERMCCVSDDVQKAMIEFAKYHVNQALLTAAESEYILPTEENIFLVNSILNAYPESNIK